MREIVSISKKMIIISIILLFISGIVLAITYEEATDIGKNYKIAGRIEDANGNLVSNCKLELVGNNYSKVIDIQDGKFEYENLPIGEYKLKINYDTTKYQVDSITTKKEEVYSLSSDYSICFMYPENSDEIYKLVDEIANKLNYIANTNGLKSLKIYKAPYQNQEELDEAAKRVLQDRKNSKLIIAFTNNKEFMQKVLEKQKALSVQPNISVSSPYRILGIYLNGNITEYMEGLYNNFFIGYQGEINKKPILEAIYKIYENNIMKVSPHRDEQTNISFTQNAEYTETEAITIKNAHDNDTTNSIVIKLKDKTEDEISLEENTTNNGGNNNQNWISQIPQTGNDSIEITVPPQNLTDSEKTIEVKIAKKVKAIKLILSDGSVFIDEQNIKWSIPNELKVISLDEELMHGATIQIEYEMTIENTSDEFDLRNVVLYDCLNYQYNNNIVYDPNTAFLTNKNKTNESQGWESSKVGDKDLLRTTIASLEKRQLTTKKLVISKVISTQDDEMYYENHMMIEKLEYGYIADSDTFKPQTINTITEESIKNSTLNNVVKSPQIIIIPPTGKINI